MFAVIFEVLPKKERFDDYLALAKQLKPKLEAIDGFIDIDRLESKRTSGRLLSFSTCTNTTGAFRSRLTTITLTSPRYPASTVPGELTSATP